MAVTQATRLGCGRDVDDVWVRIDQPPNEHEQSCPFCTQARADLVELSTATQEMTAADRQDPALRVPAQRLSDILTIVRTEVRRGRTIPLQRRADVEKGWVADLAVSEQVVATVVRETCDRNPDVEVRRVSIDAAAPVPHDPDHPHTGSGSTALEPAEVVMDLQVTVSNTSQIPDLLDTLRADLTAAVAAQIGVSVSRINVHVQDLHDA
ncbi:hypothetical protein [Lapillicoccus sp.]|uniref:hypothetical protein n=1 Tax=Lapillicoccus sp. TaxID=1909287 RepID=UPI0032661884